MRACVYEKKIVILQRKMCERKQRSSKLRNAQ